MLQNIIIYSVKFNNTGNIFSIIFIICLVMKINTSGYATNSATICRTVCILSTNNFVNLVLQVIYRLCILAVSYLKRESINLQKIYSECLHLQNTARDS